MHGQGSSCDLESTRKKKRSRLRWLISVTLLLIVAFSYTGYRLYLSYLVKHRLAAIRAQGAPVTLADLERWYPELATDQNAATDLKRAVALYEDDSKDREIVFSILQPWAPSANGSQLSQAGGRKRVRDLVLANSAASKLLRQAASRKQCRFPGSLSDLYHVPLPSSENPNQAPFLTPEGWTEIRVRDTVLKWSGWSGFPLRGAAFNLATCLPLAEVITQVEDRQATEAARSVITMLQVSRFFASEPLMTSQVDGYCLQIYAAIGLEYIVNRTSLSDADLEQIGQVLSEGLDTGGIEKAALAERCLGSAAFQSPEIGHALARYMSKSPYYSILEWMPFRVYQTTGLEELDHIVFLDRMSEYVAGVQRLVATKDMVGALDDVRLTKPRVCSKWFPLSRWSFTLHGSYSQFAEGARSAELSSMAVAVELYRNREGRLPEALNDVMPPYLKKLPEGPLDGTGLVYHRLASGYELYFVQREHTRSNVEREHPTEIFSVRR